MKQLSGLAVGVILIVVAVVVLAIGSKITDDIATPMCAGIDYACSGNSTGLAGSYDIAYSSANNGTLAMANISTWTPTIGTVLVATIIIGLLMWGFFSLFNKKNQ